MKKFTKRIISVLVLALMVCALLPTTAFAADEPENGTLAWYQHHYGPAYPELKGYEKIITQKIIQHDDPSDRDRVVVPVIFHAGYKEGSDDVVAVVYFNLSFTRKDDNHISCIYPLPTAEDLGFTANGYEQDETDPWRYDPEYFDSDYASWIYREFYFKGNDTSSLREVYEVPEKGTYDSRYGYFWQSDFGRAANVYANWKDTGDVVKVPDPKPDQPTVEKTVNGEDSASAAAGDTLNFTLTSTVPADLVDCIDYTGGGEIMTAGLENHGTVKENASYTLTFHDTMAEALSLDNDSFSVKVGNHTLTKSQYTIEANPEDDNCTFHVTLDLCSLYTAGVITDDDFTGKTSIVVSYSATLSETATAGTYKNTSNVTWIKDEKPGEPSEDDEVDVYTYKIQLTKVDKDDTSKKLPGAKFKLEKENADGSWTRVGEEEVTDDDGILAWDGLKEGTYRLTETEAPDGYVQDTKPVTVNLPGNASTTSKIANVNFTNGGTPHTGGSGTVAYTAGGLTLLVCAAGVFVLSRKKSRG